MSDQPQKQVPQAHAQLSEAQPALIDKDMVLVHRAASVSDVDQTFEYILGGGRIFCNGP